MSLWQKAELLGVTGCCYAKCKHNLAQQQRHKKVEVGRSFWEGHFGNRRLSFSVCQAVTQSATKYQAPNVKGITTTFKSKEEENADPSPGHLQKSSKSLEREKCVM